MGVQMLIAGFSFPQMVKCLSYDGVGAGGGGGCFAD